MMNFVINGLENILGKGEKAYYPHFLLYQQYLSKCFFSESLKLQSCGKGLSNRLVYKGCPKIVWTTFIFRNLALFFYDIFTDVVFIICAKEEEIVR